MDVCSYIPLRCLDAWSVNERFYTLFAEVCTLKSNPSGGGVQSVTGSAVDNTDPDNPIINLPQSGNTSEFNFPITFTGGAGAGAVGSITIPAFVVPIGYFIEEVWINALSTVIGGASNLTLGIAVDAPEAGMDSVTGDILTINANIVSRIQPQYYRSTASRIIVMATQGATISSGSIRVTVKIRKV